MNEDQNLSQEITAFQEEFNETVVECQKFCFVTRAREFQVQARDRLLLLREKAEQLKEHTIACKRNAKL
jgi:hypothetical protein